MMSPSDLHTGELLRAVVLSPEMIEENTIAALAANVSNWDDAIDRARSHGLIPMLYSQLRTIEDKVPRKAFEIAKREFERNAFHCIANAVELLQVLKEFELATISAMPFKGIVLAASAYSNFTMRSAGDLDLLIYARDLNRATAILKNRGYDLKTPIKANGFPAESDTFELHFERQSDGMVIELRWRLELTKPRFRRDLGMEWVWPGRRTVQLAGASVPNLDAVSTLLVLCMHGSKHTWSRLIWISDVAALLRSEHPLDWDLVRRESRRVGLWRCVALGVLLACQVAGAKIPTEVLNQFQSDRGARQLANFFAEQLPDHPGKMPGGPVPYNVMLLGLKDRVRLMLSTTLFKPNALDRAVITLPRAMEPLYYLIRPLRIIFDRTARP